MENGKRKLVNRVRITSFTDLEVWQESEKLMKQAYELSELLPSEEKYGRVLQLRRAVSSVPANIAEGYGRFHWLENIQFCRQARGSLEETRSHIIAAADLGQVQAAQAEKVLDQAQTVRRLIDGYIRFLNRRRNES